MCNVCSQVTMRCRLVLGARPSMMRLTATGTQRTPCAQSLLHCTACAKQTQHRCPWSQPRSITKHHQSSRSIAKHHKASKSEFCPSCRSIHPIGLMSLHPGCLAWLPPSGTRPGMHACPGTVGPSKDRKHKDADGHLASLAVRKHAQHIWTDKLFGMR